MGKVLKLCVKTRILCQNFVKCMKTLLKSKLDVHQKQTQVYTSFVVSNDNCSSITPSSTTSVVLTWTQLLSYVIIGAGTTLASFGIGKKILEL